MLYGSISSITLFSIKINNIVKSPTPGLEEYLYVNEVLIYNESKQMHAIDYELQQ